MKFKKLLLFSSVLMVSLVASATDTRKTGTQVGEFSFELQERTEKEMADVSDKTQKYILILGQDSKLKKDDLLAVKRCIFDLEYQGSAVDKAANKVKLAKLFDMPTSSSFKEMTEAVQDLACQTFTLEREKKDDPYVELTTPNYEGLNDFLKEKMYECVANSADQSRGTVVEDRGFHIPGAYSCTTIKEYCPKDPTCP